MNRDELLRMLDIKPQSANRNQETDSIWETPEDHGKVDAEGGVSRTVLLVDEWDVAQGKRCLDHSPQLKQFVTEDAMADFHTAYFSQRPQFAPDTCNDLHRQRFMEDLMASSEYRVLHQSTCCDLLATEMAATETAFQFYQYMEKEQSNPSKDETTKEINRLRVIGRAIKEAKEKVDGLLAMQMGLGNGIGSQTQLDPAQIAKLYQRIQNDHTLRRIFEMAGRFRRAAQAKQRKKTVHGYDDTTGVEMAGDVGRLLPLEMAMLADEDFELDAMRRLVEQQSMCRQFQSTESEAKGPVVICVDESSSMEGERIIQAKAFALAMAWIARHQKRWCALVAFSGEYSEGRICVLPPHKNNNVALIDWMSAFQRGGTSLEVPCNKLPNEYWNQIRAPRGKTDMVLITDGEVDCSAHMEKEFKEWKQREKCKTISLVIGGTTGGDIAKVSDEVHYLRTLNVHEDGVQTCFSI